MKHKAPVVKLENSVDLTKRKTISVDDDWGINHLKEIKRLLTDVERSLYHAGKTNETMQDTHLSDVE